MVRNPFRLMLCILFCFFLTAACSKIIEIYTLQPPAETKLPVTGTPLLITDTQAPPTKTLPPTPDTRVIPAKTQNPFATSAPTLIGWINGMVDIGGRSLFIECKGDGSPTIILEVGYTADSSLWYASGFYRRMAEITRTCRYDRANMGKSDSAPTPRTAQDAVNDLHTLLVNAQVEGPYILIGHSIGGWLVRLYADLYPKQVVGVVLLDSSHPDYGSRMVAALPTESPNESQALTAERTSWANWYKTGSASAENLDFLTSADQVRSVTSLGDIPLLVVTAGEGWGNSELGSIEKNVHFELQKELAALSTNSKQVIISNAMHTLWYDGLPDALINGISQMVEEIRANQP